MISRDVFNGYFEFDANDFQNLRTVIEKCDNYNDWTNWTNLLIETYIFDFGEDALLQCGITLLCLYVQEEWTGPVLSETVSESIKQLLPSNAECIDKVLLADGDYLIPSKYPQLLAFSIKILEHCYKSTQCHVTRLWLLRALFTQQQILDETSTLLYNRLESLITELRSSNDEAVDGVLVMLEAARIWLYYGLVEKADNEINLASKETGLNFQFSGALGRRTRFQENDIAQLVMNVSVTDGDNSVVESNVSSRPRHVALEDEVRLEEVKLTDPTMKDKTVLSSRHIAILLATLMLRKKSLPQDELSVEEHRVVVERILRSGGAWAVQLSTLLFRSHLEKNARRTVERSMMQVQAVMDDMVDTKTPVSERFVDFFISYLPTRRQVELTLAEILISLGAIKSALDIALRLEQWEMAIACYNALQLRHKAQELIQQELDKEETAKLWCLMGDATDDVSCYEKAWVLSKEKSARAQRHWGNFLYSRKKYEECIEHFEKSLAINSLQSNLLYKLGFAALHEEKWEVSAQAYRRYCILDNDCFEAWNNVARCYCELNQKRRAWRALQEALKIDHTNWRVWDNYMIVSAELKELSEVVRSYHEVLNLKKTNHIDLQVLRCLVGGFNELGDQTLRDAVMKKILELFGRLTSKVLSTTELWVLYAEIYHLEESPESFAKQRDLLLKAHRAASSKTGWEMTLHSCEQIVAILDRLLTVAVQAKPEQHIAASKMAANSSLAIIKRTHPGTSIGDSLSEKIIALESKVN